MSNLYKIFNFILKDLYLVKEIFNNLISYFHNLITFDFYELEELDIDLEEKKVNDEEKKVFFKYGAKMVRELYKKSFLTRKSFINIDLFWTKIFARKFLINNDARLFRSYFRVFSTKQGFYFNLLKLKKNNNFNLLLINSFLSGLKYI